MTKITVILLGLIVLFIDSPCSCGQSIRLATYNLNWGNRRGDQVLDAIRIAKPDVICFQETTKQSEGFLRSRLRDDYPFFHAAGHEGRFAAERFAIASKVELNNIRFSVPSAGLFGFQSAEVSIEGTKIQIFNVHLSPVVIRRDQGLSAFLNVLSATEEEHSLEMDELTKQLNLEIPSIVAGDFNSISTSIAQKKLQELGFRDSFATLYKDADSHSTWTWPTRPIPLRLRIDYVFASKHFKTISCQVVTREGSDHSLVVSELTLKDD